MLARSVHQACRFCNSYMSSTIITFITLLYVNSPVENSTCPILEPPLYGVLTFIHGVRGDLGSVALFSCIDERFSLVGEAILTCEAGNQWDYAIPTCAGNLWLESSSYELWPFIYHLYTIMFWAYTSLFCLR